MLLLTGLAAAGPVRPVTLEEPPLGYQDDQGELVGISVDLVRELQRRVGEQAPIELLPWPRAYRIASTQPDILLFTATRNREREPLFHWLLRVNRNAWILYARHGDPLPLASLDQARQVASIGVLRGGAHEALLRSQGFDNLVPFSSYTQLLESLQRGRVRLAFYSASGFLESAAKAGLDAAGFDPRYTLRTPESYIVLSKPGTTPATLARWQAAAADLVQDGTFERIARHWVERLRRERGFHAHYADGAINLWPAPGAR